MMARPKKDNNSPQMQEQILRAARIEFAAQGIAAPLDAIAQRCGIRRPSLLHHYKSKQALVSAVVDDILQKARDHLLDAIAEGRGDYQRSMQLVVKVLRDLEREEQGVAGVLLHAMLLEDEQGPVTQRVGEFIEVITATALIAGAKGKRASKDIRAVIAQLVMGELTRIALNNSANSLWGEADGVEPLTDAYFGLEVVNSE